MVKKKIEKVGEAKVLKGSHLTVTTYPNGEVNLAWDWDSLLKEVVDATGLIKVTEAKVTRTRKKKV